MKNLGVWEVDGFGVEDDAWYGSSWYGSEASESVSTKPMPGESAEAEVEGCWAASASRRQERAKTPERRMAVPRAICETPG